MPPVTEFRDVLAGLHLDTLLFFGVAALGHSKLRHAASSPASARTLLLSNAAVTLGVAALVELLVPASVLSAGNTLDAVRGFAIRIALFAGALSVAWLDHAHRRSRRAYAHHVRRHIARNAVLRAANDTATNANRAKTEFLTAMTHEIRTPLNALLAAADGALRMPLDRVQRAFISRISTETTRLGCILNEVLDLHRIEAGQLVLQRIPFTPADIARDVAELFSARAEEKGLRLLVDCALPSSLTIAGDPRRFQQVLSNLVDNGVKFTTRGSVTIGLTYTAPVHASTVALVGVSIRDTGIGITEGQRAALLAGTAPQPSSAGMPAAGLGLTIAQRVVRLMGGEITVCSASGGGSNFAFTLPVNLVHAPATAPEPVKSRHDSRRILIVDDVAANRLMLQMFLEQQGFHADYACGGEEAIQLATRNRYDAILMDLQMPVVDGFMATRGIRNAESPGERTVIVAVTASGDGITRDKCLAAGMDAHFSKPLDLRQFCTHLTDLIAARQSSRESAEPPARSFTMPLSSPARRIVR
jgi:signal transduction histidine kinase/FixJ family two-component response regulator